MARKKSWSSSLRGLDMSLVYGIIIGILGVQIISTLLVAMLPGLISNITALTGISGLEFNSFYSSGGILLSLLGIGVFMLITKLVMSFTSGSSR